MEKTAGGGKTRYIFGFGLLSVLALAFFCLNICLGSSDMSPAEAIGSLFGGGTESGRRIIFSIRLPRTLAAMLLGGALSVSGLLLQSFFSNPIAGPFVLGISSGAKLTVAAAMIFALEHGAALGSLPMTAAALAGSLGAVGVIMLMSGRVRSMAQLIVAGVMVGYICSALTELMVTFADDANIVDLHSWSMGSFSGISMRDVGFIAAAAVPAFIGAFMLSKPMSAYRLGESYARSAGVDIRAFRTALVILSSILSACVTAFAGPVSFVGVAVPHLMKALFGTSKPIVIIPASLIGGGVFCMGCDLAARLMFAPVELSVSTVTAVLGAPVVIGVMLERRGRKNDGQ